MLISGLWIMSCKKSQDIIYDPASVQLFVVNDMGVAQPEAEVRMYNDVDAYINSKKNGVYDGYIAKASTDINGKVIFEKLVTDYDYYFLIEYRDRARFVDLNNYDTEFKFSQNLTKGTYTFAKITLSQAKSVVGFYVPQDMAANLPVKLYIGNDTTAVLIDSSAATAVTGPNQKGVLDYRFSAGIQNWHAKSAKGCFWGGSINVGTTESFSPVSLNGCMSGSVSFYVDTTNTVNLPIKITLNSADQIGTLNSTHSGIPNCFGANMLSAARDTGTYTYTAESLKTSCVWQGKVKITQGGCQTILLPKCN